MLKTIAKRCLLLAVLFIGGFFLSALWADGTSWDTERLNLETTIQKRVEDALSRILPPGQFVLVVRVEPWTVPLDSTGQPIEENSGYYLPGVPQRDRFDGSSEDIKKLANSIKPDSPLFKRFIRRISATLVVDQDISEDTLSKVRELTRQLIGLDPTRGDTLDIQRTVFNKPAPELIDSSALGKLQRDLRSNWLLISLILVVFAMMVFFLFIFGPLRGFLNRFVQVLPTLKANEQGGKSQRMAMPEMMFPGMMGMQSPYGFLPPAAPQGPNSQFSGMLQVENPNKTILPFGFIREDHLGNLSILLARETPERAAVVLGYLPPDWISRVLMRIEPAQQTEIATQLATTRQLLPEQVEDIEQDLKRRLDYLIGGPDRLIAIYESLDTEAQKRMLDNLKETRPEIVDEIRQRSILFEDLEKADANSLKAILREVDLQTLVLALRGVTQSFLTKVMENITQGKAEIIKEELEIDMAPGRPTYDAQKKIAQIARRLQREGHINIPHIEISAPNTRFGGSLRDTLKLPPGLKPNDTVVEEGQVAERPAPKPSGDIEDRIRKFMGRGEPSKERYPLDDENKG